MIRVVVAIGSPGNRFESDANALCRCQASIGTERSRVLAFYTANSQIKQTLFLSRGSGSDWRMRLTAAFQLDFGGFSKFPVSLNI